MAVSIGDIIGTIKLEDTFSPKLEVAARNVEAFAGKMDRIGSRIENVGRTLTVGLTVPLAALVGTSVKAAATFESSFAGVRKTVDATEAQFASLSKEIRALAAGPNAVPIDVNELNKVAEAAGQLGIARHDIVAFTRSMADLGETTDLTADEAATATAQFQNIFGVAGKDVDRFGSTLVALGNAGASTEKQIIEMGLRIAGAGTQIGLSQGEVLAYASALSSLGIDAEAGGSAISKIMIEIALSVSKGGKELNNFAAIAGSTADKFAADFRNDAAGAVEQFISGLGRLRTSGGDVLGTLDAIGITEVRMRDALLRASGAGDLLSNSLVLQAKAWRENTALTKEAQERYKTFESQLKLTRQQINDSAITLGTALLPAIRDLLNTIQPLIEKIAEFAEWFSKLPEPVRATTLSITAFAALSGPTLFFIGGMTQGIASLLPLISKLATAYKFLAATQISAYAIGAQGTGVILSIAAAAKTATAAVVSFATSITGIGIAVAAALLALNYLISKWKEAMQAAIEYDVRMSEIVGRSKRFTLDVSRAGGTVDSAGLAQARSDVEALRKEIDKYQAVVRKSDELKSLMGNSIPDSEEVKNARAELARLTPEFDRLQASIASVKKTTTAKNIAGDPEEIRAAGVALSSLSEEQDQAVKSIQQRIAALAREDAAQKALLVALKESPEAYKAERREQEISNTVFEARQALLESQLTLTPALEARIRSLTGSIFDSREAAESYNRILAAVEQAQNTVLAPSPDSDPWGAFADNGILDAFNRSLADQQNVLEEINGEHNRQARAIRAVNALLANGLITEEQRNEYMRQFSDLWEAIPAEITIAEQLLSDMVNTLAGAGEVVSTALADGLVEAAFEGGEAWDDLADQLESIFRRLIADWLSQWIRAMAQWLAKWIATQAKAKAAQAALGTGGGGGVDAGTVAGIGSNIGGGTGTYAGGGAAAAGGGTSALVAGGATLAIFAAIYIGVSAWIRSHKEHAGQVTFQLAKESGAAVNDIKGSLNKVNGLTDSVKAAGKAVNDWLEELGGALEGMSEKITIGSSGQGKGTRHFVIDEGVKKWFATYEQALEFAILEALKTSDVSGFSQLMKEGLATGASESLDELKDLMTSLREVSDLNLSPAVVQAREAAIRFNELWQVLTDLPAATSAVIEGFSSLIVSEAMMWQNLFNSLTGKQLSESEIRAQKEKQLELATIEFNIRKAQIQQRIYQIGVEILALKASNAFTNGIGGDRNNGRGGGLVGVAYAFAMAGSVISQTAVMVETSVNGLSQSVLDMIAALEAEAAALAKLLEALPTPPSPGDIQPSGGRGGGSGPSSADLRTDLRSEIARMVAEAEGELHALVFDFDQAIADITERAKEAKLPAEELAAAIALMTQKLQEEIRTRAEALAGIGTDFTRRLRDTIDFFREIRELGRKKTGMPDWLVDLLEGKALAKLGTEINGAIAAFNGMTDPMLAIQMQADELRENFLAWAEAAGLSAEEIAQGTAAIESGREFQRQSAITGILDTVFGYLKDAPQYAGQLVEFEKMKIDLQFRLIEAQLRALGAWDATTEQMVNDARQIANDLAEGSRELDRSVARFRGYNDDESDPWRRVQDFVKDQTQAFRAGIKGLIDSTQDLFTDDELTNLTQEEQMAAARARVMDLIAKAEGGDVEALGDLAAARAEFLSELRESEGAGFGFDQGWDEIMGRTADLLANAQDIEADVVAKAWEDAIANDDENTEDITEAIYDSARILAQEIRDAINGVPALATGGIVMSGPRLVRVAEHSPEAIVPLDRLMSAIPYTYQEPADKIGPTPTLPTTSTVSVYDQSERFRQFQRQNDSANRLSKIEESNRAMAMTMARMQQDMSALRRKMM